MSLNVNAMVKEDSMENAGCILCGMCIDDCPKGVISYSFQAHEVAEISLPGGGKTGEEV
jgi:ferredoxin